MKNDMKTLSQFTRPEILKSIGYIRLAKLLEPFRQDLPDVNIVPENSDRPADDYYKALAAVFADPTRLPERLRSALFALERLGAPENAWHLHVAILNHFPRTGFGEMIPVDCALEFWLVFPDKLFTL